MDGLELIFLARFLFTLTLTQETTQQELNAILRQRQGFPGQIQRNFFIPNGQGTTTESTGLSNQGVFTVDRHVKIPTSSLTGGSKRFNMENSQKSRIETPPTGQFEATRQAIRGMQGEMSGPMNQGWQTGDIHEQTDVTNRSKLDASSKTDIVATETQGFALKEGGLLSGERRSGASSQGVKDAVDQIGTDTGEDSRFRQGQFVMSNQAQLLAERQKGETLAKESAVPPGVLNAARRVQSGVGGQDNARLGDLQNSQHKLQEGQLGSFRKGQLSSSQEDQISVPREGEVSGSRNFRASSSEEGQFIRSRERQFGFPKEGQVGGLPTDISSGSRKISESREVQSSVSGRGRINNSLPNEISSFKELQPSGSRAGLLSGSGDAPVGVAQDKRTIGSRDDQTNVSKSQTFRLGAFRTGGWVDVGSHAPKNNGSRDFQVDDLRGRQNSGFHERQVSGLDGGQISGFRDFQIGISPNRQVNGSREDQIQKHQIDGVSGDKNIGKAHKRINGIHQSGSRILNEGKISMSNQADLRAGGQGEQTVEGEINVPTKTINPSGLIKGTILKHGESGLGGDRKLDLSGSRQFDLSGQKKDNPIVIGQAAIMHGQTSHLDGRQVEFRGTRQQSNFREGQTRDFPRNQQRELSSQDQVGTPRVSQAAILGESELSVARDARLGLSEEAKIGGPQGGETGVFRNAEVPGGVQLEKSRQGGTVSALTPNRASRESQISTSNQVNQAVGGQGQIRVEEGLTVPVEALNAAGQLQGGALRREGVSVSGDQNLAIRGLGQQDVSEQVRGQTELSAQRQKLLERSHLDLTGLDQSAQRMDTTGREHSVLDLSGQEQIQMTSRPSETVKREEFPGTGRSIVGIGEGQRIGKGDSFIYSHVSVNIRCYADPQKGLSCGIDFPDDQCKEKWDFPNPCTRENMDMNITKFVHPYDNSKFLMCGEMGKLYIVQCPRLEIFHAGCGQCVDENVGLTASCEEPLTPQISNPCTTQNIIDNKLFFPYPGNLSKFIHCDVWGKPWVRDCTVGEVWNLWDVACVLPALINPCSRLNADLAYLYPHPCDPKRYLRCDAYGVAYEDFCGPNEAFNEATQYCDPVGSFYGSDRPEYCENYIFGFKSYRNQAMANSGFRQGRGRLDRDQEPGRIVPIQSQPGANGGGSHAFSLGVGGQTGKINQGPERTDFGQGIIGRPISGSEGVTNLAGTITIHRSKISQYQFRKNQPYAEPCTAENIKEGRYHFRVLGDPHSFIQCDNNGFSHLMPCSGAKAGPKDYFDPWTNTCVDGPVHVDNRINSMNG